MADNERPSGFAIINAIRTQRQLRDAPERSDLNDTLVKSALWKEKTLQRIDESANAIGTHELPPEEVGVIGTDQLGPSGDNDDTANPDDRRQSTTRRRRSEETERLRQTIIKLEVENGGLAARRQEELDAHKNELLEFQAAYDQFQQQSDLLINELDQENERLRTECKLTNRRSLL